MISLQLAGFRWGMTTCALLAKHPHIVAGVCLMGSPAPLEYGKEIVSAHRNIIMSYQKTILI